MLILLKAIHLAIAPLEKTVIMKKLVLGAVASLCMLGAHAEGVDDYIGTWQLARTTVPNMLVIKKEGVDLVAVRYVRNTLTGKLAETRFPATYVDGAVNVPALEPKLETALVGGVPTLTLMGEAFQKVSSATSTSATDTSKLGS